MILLHLILSNYPDLPDDELLEDVEKSLQIFESMDDIIVARRCAEMLREVLEVAGTCLLRRRRGEMNRRGSGLGIVSSGSASGLSGGCTLTGAGTASYAPGGSASTIPPSTGTSLPGMEVDAPAYHSSDVPTLPLENMTTSEGLDNRSNEEDFFFSLFSQDPHRPPDRTRTEMLANLVDPSILEDFAFGQEMSFF